ncbi:MAG TPA: tetratricopeptide repeat protein [Methylomirabilota bacterium]|nr:tetratricopeptide repeat protein [Methylomirabilota bacterium]
MIFLRWLLPVAVAVLSFLAFLPALHGEFLNWDDFSNFANNDGFRGLGWTQLKWMWTATLLGHYIPLTWMSLGLNYTLGGMNPWGYHLGNLLLHAANALVFYFLALRLLRHSLSPSAGEGQRLLHNSLPPSAGEGQRLLHNSLSPSGGEGQGEGEHDISRPYWGAAFAALVFSLHPLRVESVAWVTERRDVLYTLFFLLSALAYLRSVEPGEPHGGRWRLASLAAFVAALLSKAAAMTLPAALLVMDVYPLRRLTRDNWKRVVILEKIPYGVLAVAGAVVAMIAVRQGAVVTPYSEYGIPARIAMTLYSFWIYPWTWVWPVGLSPLYELPARVDPLAPRFLLPAVGLVAVTAALIALRRRWPGALAAWLFSALMILPVSGAVHAGYQLAHDRYSYVSGLGFAVLAGGVLAWVLGLAERRRLARWVKPVMLAGAAAAVLLLGAGTWDQTGAWKDSETLWRGALALDPECMICHNNLGSALFVRKQYREAEAEYRAALALRPGRAPTHNNLGTALIFQERYAEAEQELKEALRLQPTLTGARANLGAVYGRQGRYEEAVRVLREAYQEKPDFPDLPRNLAQALRGRGAELALAGRTAEALPLFSEAVQVWPDDPDTWSFLGQALLREGKPAEAAQALLRSVVLSPKVAATRFWLARAFIEMGDRERADAELIALRALSPAMADEFRKAHPAGPGR